MFYRHGINCPVQYVEVTHLSNDVLEWNAACMTWIFFLLWVVPFFHIQGGPAGWCAQGWVAMPFLPNSHQPSAEIGLRRNIRFKVNATMSKIYWATYISRARPPVGDWFVFKFVQATTWLGASRLFFVGYIGSSRSIILCVSQSWLWWRLLTEWVNLSNYIFMWCKKSSDLNSLWNGIDNNSLCTFIISSAINESTQARWCYS